MRIIFLLGILFLSKHAQAADCLKLAPIRTWHPQESKSFYIDYFNGFKVLYRGTDKVLLVDKNSKLPCQSNLFKIETPIQKIVLTSTTQLPALELLAEEKTLIGFQGKRYIYSNHFSMDKIIDISLPLIPEELLKIKPDLVVAYDLNISSPKFISQLRKLQIPVVLNNDYLEETSLARAEWIIFTASFFNKEVEAQKIFNEIRTRYYDIKNKTQKISQRKKVLVGEIQNGKWVMCGGRSDFAQLIHDAGGDMLLSSTSSSPQRRSLEDIYLMKTPVDVWLTQNNWSNLTEIQKDSRYKKVNAQKIFNIYARRGSSGSNDYWEMGMARPDILLEDLATVFYPQNFAKHNLVWYKKL